MTTLHTLYADLAASRQLANLLLDPVDQALCFHDQDGERDSNLPSEAELLDNGVDLVALAHYLKKGLNARDFTTVLRAGMLEVGSFNEGPRTRTSSGRRDFNMGMATLADGIRSGAFPCTAS